MRAPSPEDLVNRGDQLCCEATCLKPALGSSPAVAGVARMAAAPGAGFEETFESTPSSNGVMTANRRVLIARSQSSLNFFQPAA